MTSSRQPRLHLADFLPYRLNVVTQAISHGLAQHYADIYGISIPEWRIIATAGEFGEMTARDIASHSRMSKVMTSRAATSLLKRRLLARRINRDDRRESFLRLSEQGEAIYAALVPKALAYQVRLMEGLSKNDIAALDRIIGHFMDKAETDALQGERIEALLTA
jgi:DNA-binding MarR family transcriptional regulator